MPDYAKLLFLITTAREGAETLHRSVTDHLSPDTEIALALAALIIKYASIEADIRARDAKLLRSGLSPIELYEISERISRQLGNVLILSNGLQRIFHPGKVSRPSVSSIPTDLTGKRIRKLKLVTATIRRSDSPGCLDV